MRLSTKNDASRFNRSTTAAGVSSRRLLVAYWFALRQQPVAERVCPVTRGSQRLAERGLTTTFVIDSTQLAPANENHASYVRTNWPLHRTQFDRSVRAPCRVTAEIHEDVTFSWVYTNELLIRCQQSCMLCRTTCYAVERNIIKSGIIEGIRVAWTILILIRRKINYVCIKYFSCFFFLELLKRFCFRWHDVISEYLVGILKILRLHKAGSSTGKFQAFSRNLSQSIGL